MALAVILFVGTSFSFWMSTAYALYMERISSVTLSQNLSIQMSRGIFLIVFMIASMQYLPLLISGLTFSSVLLVLPSTTATKLSSAVMPSSFSSLPAFPSVFCSMIVISFFVVV